MLSYLDLLSITIIFVY